MSDIYPCQFCGNVTENDSRGNCATCGAPRGYDQSTYSKERTQAAGQPSIISKIAASFPGAPTKTVATLALGEGKALIIDLNKYRPNKNLQQYIDAGVDLFYLRIGGPYQWVSGNWMYQEDITWRPYLEQLDLLGMRGKTLGYIIHNPFEDWRLVNNVHVDLLNQWTSGGYMPGGFLLDHEISKCWNAGVQVTCTPYNLVNSLSATLLAIYKWAHKVCGVYTARWFIDSNGPVEHTTYFDNINKPVSLGGPGEQIPTIFAWYPQNATFGSKTYTNLDESLNDLLVPTGDQVGRFLSVGSYTQYKAWQYTDRLKLAEETAVDANVTAGTKEAFMRAFGLLDSPTPPPVEPPPSTSLETRVANLENWAKSYSV